MPSPGWMSVATTSTPSRFNLSATAAPIPLAAPVTSALRPFSPSSGIGSAVDVDDHARHVRRIVGAQRNDQRCTLVDRADTPHRYRGHGPFRSALLAGERHYALQSTTRDHAGRDAIDAYPMGSELERELPREAHDARLGHGVRSARPFGSWRNALTRRDRRHVDDGAALLLQVWRRSAAAIEHGIQVDRDDGAPILERAIGEAAEAERRRAEQVLARDAPASADAVDEHVDAAELLQRFLNHFCYGRRVGDIRPHAKALPHRAETFLVQVRDHDLHAFLQKPVRHLVADAVGLGAAGDDRHFHLTTLFRRMPMPSTSSSTVSPGFRKRICSRPQPLPTVPEPKNSPGCRVSEREACAMQSSNFQCMSRELPRPHSSPLTRATISRRYGSPISSAVTRHGPIALALSKSLPLPGPSCPAISRLCSSRAEKSLKMV